jgi:hypothetical protein
MRGAGILILIVGAAARSNASPSGPGSGSVRFDGEAIGLSSATRMRRRRPEDPMNHDEDLAAEVALLEVDEKDRAEMLAVARFMASLRPTG